MDRFDRARWGRGVARGSGGIVGGVILAGIGVVLLLQNLGIPYFDDLEKFWPVILMLVGGTQVIRSVGTGGRIWGGLMFVVGVIFLLFNFGVIHGDVWRFLWPGMLIMIGLGMLAKAIDRNNPGAPPTGATAAYGSKLADDIRGRIMSDWSGAQTSAASLDRMSEWAIFGGTRRRIDSQNFQGGEAFAMFGGVEIDLRKAGTNATEVLIDANAIFGGVELRVPENWNIVVRGAGIFGGYEDKTMDARNAPDSKAPVLIVNGLAVFGGVTIQN